MRQRKGSKRGHNDKRERKKQKQTGKKRGKDGRRGVEKTSIRNFRKEVHRHKVPEKSLDSDISTNYLKTNTHTHIKGGRTSIIAVIKPA